LLTPEHAISAKHTEASTKDYINFLQWLPYSEFHFCGTIFLDYCSWISPI